MAGEEGPMSSSGLICPEAYALAAERKNNTHKEPKGCRLGREERLDKGKRGGGARC
jgi:hypothetical protein